jgi:transposase
MTRDGRMDGHLDVSGDGYAGRLEVIGGPTGRRRRSVDAKARIALESLVPGATVAEVARKHAVTRWQVYDWRKRLRDGRLVVADGVAGLPAFAALAIDDPRDDPRPPPLQADSGVTIEVVVGGVVIRAAADADEAHLARVIRAARTAATA